MYKLDPKSLNKHGSIDQPYPTPCLQRRELASLSGYSFYVQNFLTRARCTRHPLQKHCVERVIF